MGVSLDDKSPSMRNYQPHYITSKLHQNFNSINRAYPSARFLTTVETRLERDLTSVALIYPES